MQIKYSLLHRLWHWMMAFSVIGLLITVLLRKTFLSYKANALIIQEKLAALDIDISIESAKLIGKAIRAPMWEWHYIFATFLALSIVIRIYMFLSKRALHPIPDLLRAPKEEKLQKTVYLFLCLFIMLMTVSGGALYFYEELGFVKESMKWVKDLHENMMYGVLFLVVLHLAGVLRHEIMTKEGIISKMIHGERD